jgi:glycosyltransferase involved in cell wall biosynthesis
VGEVNDQQKRSFLGKALAMLFPINWPEPFGLVMIEAMGCGTPVMFLTGKVTIESVERTPPKWRATIAMRYPEKTNGAEREEERF